MDRQPHKPGRFELRKFGLAFALVLALLFGIVIPLFRHGVSGIGLWPQWPWIAAVVIVTWSIVAPATLIALYLPWMRFAAVAQWVNTRIILVLLFYFVIFPIGLLLRLFGKDPMRRRLDPSAASYRVAADETQPDHVEKPY